MASNESIPAGQIVQAVFALLLGLLGLLGGALAVIGAIFLAGALIGVEVLGDANVAIPQTPFALWAQILSGSIGGLSSLITSLAAVMSAGVLLASRKAWPLVWAAAACAVHIVIFDLLGAVILFLATLGDLLQVTGGAGDPTLWITQGGGLCGGLTLALLRLGFWAWTFTSARHFAASRPTFDDPVMTFD